MTEGWYCPRCHKINAPWVPQCSCGDTNINWNPDTGRTTNNPWWKDVTCSTTTIVDDGTVTTFNDKTTS